MLGHVTRTIMRGAERFKNLWIILLMCAIIIPVRPGAFATEVDGVQMPETMAIAGKLLHLNGYGVRTYSILALHIYTAALYLEHLSTDASAIIRSLDTVSAGIASSNFRHSLPSSTGVLPVFTTCFGPLTAAAGLCGRT
jgi:Chalcone isomerase-like